MRARYVDRNGPCPPLYRITHRYLTRPIVLRSAPRGTSSPAPDFCPTPSPPVTAAGEDISDYLTYVTDSHGHLHCELPNGATGKLYIAATDHRPDPEGACGRLWSNTYTLVVVET